MRNIFLVYVKSNNTIYYFISHFSNYLSSIFIYPISLLRKQTYSITFHLSKNLQILYYNIKQKYIDSASIVL